MQQGYCLTHCAAAVVDNIPKVAAEKQEKLMSVIDRIFGQIGSVKEGRALAFSQEILVSHHMAIWVHLIGTATRED